MLGDALPYGAPTAASGSIRCNGLQMGDSVLGYLYVLLESVRQVGVRKACTA